MIFLVDNRNNSDPFINLAIEDHLLRFSEKSFLLIYVNSPSVVIGRNQNVYEEANVKFCREKKINIVRRISGGGAVYHDKGNLSYSFISDYDRELYNNYEKFSLPSINVLQKLKLDAFLNDRNDIIIGRKKISGNAQFTSRKRMITHGTLLFDADLSALRKSLKVNLDEFTSKSTQSKRSPVANILDELEVKISIDEFKTMLVEEFSSEYGGIDDYKFSDNEWAKITESAETKFNNWNWIYERIPKFEINRERIIDEEKYNLYLLVDKGVIQKIKISSSWEKVNAGDIEGMLLGRNYLYDEVERTISETGFHFSKIIDLLF